MINILTVSNTADIIQQQDSEIFQNFINTFLRRSCCWCLHLHLVTVLLHILGELRLTADTLLTILSPAQQHPLNTSDLVRGHIVVISQLLHREPGWLLPPQQSHSTQSENRIQSDLKVSLKVK